jgi:lipopolysaccharide/colanic/teichoic acid biosynthesis glycosyltransferase
VRLFNRYFTAYDVLLVVGDFALVWGASLATRQMLQWAGSSSAHSLDLLLLHGLAMALIVVISFYYSDLYAIDQTLSVHELSHRFAAGLGMACIIIGVISYPIPNFGKSVYVSEMLVMGFSLAFWRFGFMRVINQASIRAKVLIIGTRAIGRMVAEELYLKRNLGMEVIGFVSENAGRVALTYGNPKKVEIPIFAPPSLCGLVVSSGIDRILLAGADFGPHSSKIAITDLPPEWIALSKGFRRDRLILAAKRIIDVVVSFLGLILSVPLILLTAIAIKLESSGPLFYRQERVGENERYFTLLKFRSMTKDAEAQLGPVWAAENDPRVTRVGAIIRKLRIDEIPQMINVLRGEMSFVGPRPERPYFVATLKQNIPYYDLRHSVKPGITGWAQICYRYGDSEQDAIEKLQYDLYYIKHMSPVFDLQIIFESFKVIVFGWGAR